MKQVLAVNVLRSAFVQPINTLNPGSLGLPKVSKQDRGGRSN